MADEDDGALFTGELQRFEMDFGNQWAGRINNLQRSVFGFLADRRRHSVSAENQNSSVGNRVDAFDENCAPSA
jgi:hypothetical protein